MNTDTDEIETMDLKKCRSFRDGATVKSWFTSTSGFNHAINQYD